MSVRKKIFAGLLERWSRMEGLSEDNAVVNVTVAFPVDLAEKLDELAKAKYRGVKRPMALRWIVEDAYQAYQEEVKG